MSTASRLRALGTSMTVSVTGSTATSAVDDTGHFTLRNVPAGHVELHFVGAGVDARLPLDNVAEHATITIAVVVSGTTAQLDNDEREDPNNNAEVEGLVTAVGASTLTVGGKTVTVNASTTIVHGDTTLTLSSIHIGDRVHVHGTMSGTSIVATKIEVQQGAATPGHGDDGNNHEAEVEGAVSAVGASSLTVNGQVVSVVSTTQIVNHGSSVALSSIHVGDRVEAKGTMSGATLVASRIEVETSGSTPGNGGGDNHGEVELSGTVSGRSASCPVTFTMSSTKVVTNAGTQFRDTTCATLANGDNVEVQGTKQTDGSVLASRVEKKK